MVHSEISHKFENTSNVNTHVNITTPLILAAAKPELQSSPLQQVTLHSLAPRFSAALHVALMLYSQYPFDPQYLENVCSSPFLTYDVTQRSAMSVGQVNCLSSQSTQDTLLKHLLHLRLNATCIWRKEFFFNRTWILTDQYVFFLWLVDFRSVNQLHGLQYIPCEQRFLSGVVFQCRWHSRS